MVIIAISVIISDLKKIETAIQFLEKEYYGLVPETVFIIFGLFCIIYIFYCVIMKKDLHHLFILPSLIALSGVGYIIQDNFCTTSIMNCHPYTSRVAGSIIYVLTNIFLIAYIEKIAADQKLSKLFDKFSLLMGASIFALIGIIIVLGGTISLGVTFKNKNQYFSGGYITDFILFLIFGSIVSIYGIICGMKKITPHFLYPVFLSFAIPCCGGILYISGYIIDLCTTENFNIGCDSHSANFTGTLTFLISVFVIIISRQF